MQETEERGPIPRGSHPWTDALLSVVGTMVVVLDRAGRVVEVSAETCRVLAAPRERIVGRDWFATFLPERCRDEVRRVGDEILAGRLEPVEHYENPVLTANGAERAVRWHNTLLRGPDGRVEWIVSSGMDITDRVETEATLRSALRDLAASEARYRTVFETAATAIARLHRDGTILDCNRRVEEVFGLPARGLVGRPAATVIHPADHPRLAKDLADIGDLGTYQRRVYRALRPDGAERIIEVDAAAVPREGPDRYEIVCQVSDVTARARDLDLERLSARLLGIAHRHDDLGSLARATCEALREATGCPAVSIRRTLPDGALETLAQVGFPLSLHGPGVALRVDSRCGCGAVLRGEEPVGSALRTAGGSYVVRDATLIAEAGAPWGEACGRALRAADLCALATVPIRQGERVVGLLQIAAPTALAIPDDVVLLLEGAALQLGQAMRRIDAEQRLQRQIAFQRALLDAIPIPVTYSDDAGTTRGRNRAWVRNVGVAGDPAGRDLPTDRFPWEIAADAGGDPAGRPPRSPATHRMRDANGQTREVELHQARFAEPGGVAGAVQALVDVTALKRATTALQDLNSSLEARIEVRNAEILALHRLSRDLVHARSIEDVARAALHQIQGAFPAEVCALALFDGARTRAFARALRPVGPSAATGIRQRLAAELGRLDLPGFDSPLALAGTHPVTPAPGSLALHLESVYLLPLHVEGRTQACGALLVAAEAAGAFSEHQARAFDLAAVQIAQAVQRVGGRPNANPTPTPSIADPGSSAQADTLLQRLPVAVLVLDARLVVVLANRAATELLGLPADGLPAGGIPAEVLPWDASRLGAALLPGALQAGSRRIADLRFRDPLGRPGLLHVRLVPLEDPGRPGATLLIAEDASEQRALEARLVQARKMESIGQLAAGIAHEINTPAQYVGDNLEFLASTFDALKGSLIALRDADFQPPGEHPPDNLRAIALDTRRGLDLAFLTAEVPLAIEQAREGIARISAIVGAMREFSHGAGTAKVVTDINRCVQSTVAVARHEWKYVAEVVLDLDPALPTLPTLPAELNQVLLNLLVNAAHAITEAAPPEGKGTITIRSERWGHGVRIEVIDNGCGIPFELQSRIFEPFFTTKPVGRGTGQGLAISRAMLTEKLGGQLDFESTPGVGTTFRLTLPGAA